MNRDDELRDMYAEAPWPDEPPPDEHQGDAEATTWEPLDLTTFLDGSHVSPQPAIGISRTDGQKLLYPGREHLVFGETEAGKSWFALECVAVELRRGRNVVYIHYEEGDAAGTVERLQLLGATPEQIGRHLRFVAPSRPVRGSWLTPLLSPAPVLVIHDGVNEAMSLHGDDTNAADGAATFRRTVIKPFLNVGATSLSADHVTKNGGDNRGRYASGSGHKVNAIDGAAFLMENTEPFGRGLRGSSSVFVTKDRPGQLRAHGKPTGIPGKTYIGRLVVDATGDSADLLTFWPPKPDEAAPQAENVSEADAKLADEVWEVIASQPDRTVPSWRRVRALVSKAGISVRDEKLRSVLELLVVDDRLTEVPGRAGAKGYQAVLSASQPSDEAVRPASASASASPIEGDAGTQSHASASDALGRTGTQSSNGQVRR